MVMGENNLELFELQACRKYWNEKIEGFCTPSECASTPPGQQLYPPPRALSPVQSLKEETPNLASVNNTVDTEHHESPVSVAQKTKENGNEFSGTEVKQNDFDSPASGVEQNGLNTPGIGVENKAGLVQCDNLISNVQCERTENAPIYVNKDETDGLNSTEETESCEPCHVAEEQTNLVNLKATENHCHELDQISNQSRTEKKDCVVVDQTQDKFFHWYPPDTGEERLDCSICEKQLSLVDLEIHYHQFHVNPRFLSQHDVKHFRLSNFLVNNLEDTSVQSTFPGLFRCHECFNTFSESENLKLHLVKHKTPSKMAPKTHETSEQVYSESLGSKRVLSKKRRGSTNVEILHNKDRKIDKASSKYFNKSRPRRQASMKRIVELESEISDEFNSNSENEADLTNRRAWRPQRECKSRTKTLVAISLAEQEYDKFDLDFGKFKTDVNSKNSQIEESIHPVDEIAETEVRETSRTFKQKAVSGEKSVKSKGLKKVKIKRGKRGKKSDNLSVLGTTEQKKGRMKVPTFSVKDQKKASKMVEDILENTGDYVCLRCGINVNSYRQLISHKRLCGQSSAPLLAGVGLERIEPKVEDITETSSELSNYVTGAVTQVPETSFNSMHGKMADLKTEDANQFLNNSPNALGLVRLNYSGQWSVKDVWEIGGWEPRVDQLTWQRYELAAAVSSALKLKNKESEVKALKETEEMSNENGDNEKPKSNEISPVTSASIVRNLTSQVVGRQPPIITNTDLQRDFLIKLSGLPWTEQRKIKESFDSAVTAKKTRKPEKPSESSFRHLSMPARLDLKQVGKSIKYSKSNNRNPPTMNKKEGESKPEMVLGTLSGEWEVEHSFVCSVCGIEYDDVLEIMHHKWEAHPHCLVAHVSLKHNLQRPPALLYPQVGPSTIHLDSKLKEEKLVPFLCSKCQLSFEEGSEFHAHILLCGGVSPWDKSPSKKKRRKGHGGGLKSTIRMMKKSSHSRDGTDTDEPSPKKRVRAAPRVFGDVPLVPIHNRTTRFKETKEKEAKVLEAKKKRRDRGGKRTQKPGGKRKITAENVDNVVVSVVSDLVEKVHNKEKRRSHRSKAEQKKKLDREKRSSRRIQDVQQYKELSSEDSVDEDRENEDGIKNQIKNEIPTEIVKTVNELIDSVLSCVENSRNSNNNTSMKGKIVRVQIVPDETSFKIADHCRIISACDLVQDSPSKRSNKKRSLSPNLNHTPVEDKSEENGPKINGFLDTSTPSKDLIPTNSPVNNVNKVRSLFSSSSKSSPGRRNLFPIELKVSAIQRIDDGESQASVAKDLDISFSTLVKWCVRRSELLGKFSSVTQNTGSVNEPDITSNAEKDNVDTDTPKDVEDSSSESGSGESSVRNSRSSSNQRSRSSSREYRPFIPLEIKSAAIERVLAGETQIAVSRDLNINPSTLAHWWGKKEVILDKVRNIQELSAVPEEILKPLELVHDDEPQKSKVKPKSEGKTGVKPKLSCRLYRERLLQRIKDGEKIQKVSKSENIPKSKLISWIKRYKRSSKLGNVVQSQVSKTKINGELSIQEKNNLDLIEQKNLTSSSEDVSSSEIEREPSFPVSSDPQACRIVEPEVSDVDVNTKPVETIRPRRQSVGAPSHPTLSGFRLFMPLGVKREAVTKIINGESQASVARDLDISVSTVSTWWRKRESILSTEELSNEAGEEIEDPSVDELGEIEKSGTPVIDEKEQDLHEEVKEDSALDSSAPDTTVPVAQLVLPNGKEEILKSMKSAFSSSQREDASKSTSVLVPKKKSLEFLANNLMKKALAFNVLSVPTSALEDGSQLYLSGDMKEKRGSGLGLIANNYLSSEEES